MLVDCLDLDAKDFVPEALVVFFFVAEVLVVFLLVDFAVVLVVFVLEDLALETFVLEAFFGLLSAFPKFALFIESNFLDSFAVLFLELVTFDTTFSATSFLAADAFEAVLLALEVGFFSAVSKFSKSFFTSVDDFLGI